MATIDDNNALLLYRVGPVLCCAPCLPISAIIEPRPLTRPPGTSRGRPGIFKHANTIVSALDLRHKFGVEPAAWVDPGRIVVTHLDQGAVGFHVDAILDVITLPSAGWGPLPPLLPRGIFSRTLLLKNQIYLYADFQDLLRIPDSGYLRQYIVHLLETERRAQDAQAGNLPAVATATTPNPQTVLAASSRSTSPPTDSPATSPRQPTVAALSAPGLPSTSHPVSAPTGKTTPAAASATPPSQRTPQSSRHHPPTLTRAQARRRPVQRQTPAKVVAPQTPPTKPVQVKAVVTTLKPNSPIQPSTPSPPRMPANTAAATNTHRWLSILLWLLLLGAGSGTALWYGFLASAPSPVATLSAPVVTSTPPPSLARPQAITPTDTPTTPAAQTHAVTEAVTTNTDTNTAVTNTGNTEEPLEAMVETTAAADTTATTEPTQYSATIERDAQGLTITLEAPADDPVFTQPGTPTTVEVASEVDASTPPGQSEPSAEAAAPALPTPPVAQPTEVETVEIIHIVVKGDTLWHIARRYVHNPFRYPELARLSKITNPDLIYPGDRIRILKRKRQP